MVGIEVTPYWAAVDGFSSTFSFATTISSWSAATSSRIGAIMRHGPHHSAQKSTMTGLSLSRTSSAKPDVGHGFGRGHGSL